MSIPAIRPYPMPTEADLGASVPSWRPDAGRALLLIHDMQRYFVDLFPAGEAPMRDLLANLRRIRHAATALGMPVVYTAQPGRMSRRRRGLLRDFWGPGMRSDGPDREIVSALRPGPGDVLVEKCRYSAFHDTGLAEVLRTHRRDQLIVCGVFAHIGCLMTACDAFTRDVEPFLIADAVADFTAPDHRMALEYAARTCAVTMTTGRLLDLLVARDDPGQLDA
ncbi:isochorismatase family protein [Phytohabitans rumicis]|uniref:Isochorismatase-like domain-containing protein n=1 Tax=Phytohabitans rumicis TaxID=1076125 RepID=A0A6V8KRV4_9ACTN|nr:isochorismatase family protein [Phytohabitans rumicis]GFJ86584.1 hypothetical protein Prum_002260 [Phytohabitans rumicis]